MNSVPADDSVTAALSAALCGDVPWRHFQITAEEFHAACTAHGVAPLLSRRVRAGAVGADWPAAVTSRLVEDARVSAAAELLVAADLAVVIDALAEMNVTPILFKGAALAYSAYASPELRPRGDCDMLIRESDLGIVRRVLEAHGCVAALSCEKLFGQIRFDKSTPLGITHAIDLHWRISTQALFADVVSYDELAAESVRLHLSPRARGAGSVHALLLACVHPVMHHRNQELLIWTHDIHLLAAGLSPDEWRRFTEMSRRRGVSAISARQLTLAARRFGTAVPAGVLVALAASGEREPTAGYLAPGRQWRHELAANLRGATDWPRRLQLLRLVVLPSGEYMMRRYGLRPSAWARLMMPALHVRRLTRGVVNVMLGRK